MVYTRGFDEFVCGIPFKVQFCRLLCDSFDDREDMDLIECPDQVRMRQIHLDRTLLGQFRDLPQNCGLDAPAFLSHDVSFVRSNVFHGGANNELATLLSKVFLVLNRFKVEADE